MTPPMPPDRPPASKVTSPGRRPRRIPVRRKVSLKFKDLKGFVTELSENISMGGMFIRTERPQAPGTVFDFELVLDREGPLIQGIGEVVWHRPEDDGPDRPAGMGVRFLELAPGGRALIYKMVDEHIRSGGDPFSLESSKVVFEDEGAEVPGGFPTSTAAGERCPGGPDDRSDAASDAASGDEPVGAHRPVRPSSYAVLASPQRHQAELRGDEGTTPRRHLGRWLLAAGLSLGVIGGGLWLGLGWAGAGDEPPAAGSEGSGAGATAERTRTPEAVNPGDAPEPDDAGGFVPGQEDGEGDGVEAGIGPGHTTVELTAGETRGQTAPEDRVPEHPVNVGEATSPGQSPPEPPRESAPSGPPTRSGGEAERTSAEPPAGDPVPDSHTVPESETATEIRSVSWERRGAALVVVLRGDGTFRGEGIDHFRMGEGDPREVVRIRGIREPYRPAVAVGEPELRRIRTGHHRRAGGEELHVVLDLGSPRVRLVTVEPAGDRLEIVLEER